MVNKKVLAIILGGGQGTRLAPLTNKRSKPAVSIAGKYRLVDIPISNCIHCDIKRMFVLTQFNSASLNRHIKNTYNFSSFSKAFVDILAAEQTPENKTWFQGTADAVRQSMPHILNHEFEYALILSGDQLYQMDLNDMIAQHESKGAEISIATLPVDASDATGFGILKTDDNSFISSFVEKPSSEELVGWESEVDDQMKAANRNYLASMGIYIFNRQLLVDIMSNPDTIDFGKEIIPSTIGKNKVLAYQYKGYWEDIGTIKSFFDANIGLTDEKPEFDLFDKGNTILTRPRILPPSKISGTLLTQSIIADGCMITAASVKRSVIGIRSVIGKGSKVENTYMIGANIYQGSDEVAIDKEKGIPHIGVGENCTIENTIIDKDARIGNNVIIKGGSHLKDAVEDAYIIKEGIVVIRRRAIIPNGFELQ